VIVQLRERSSRASTRPHTKRTHNSLSRCRRRRRRLGTPLLSSRRASFASQAVDTSFCGPIDTRRIHVILCIVFDGRTTLFTWTHLMRCYYSYSVWGKAPTVRTSWKSYGLRGRNRVPGTSFTSRSSLFLAVEHLPASFLSHDFYSITTMERSRHHKMNGKLLPARTTIVFLGLLLLRPSRCLSSRAFATIPSGRMADNSGQSGKIWDRFADGYAKQPIADPASYQKKLQVTQQYLKPFMQVLEIGCGTGGTSILHAPHVQHILATDISSKMVEIARRNAEQADFPAAEHP